MTFPLDFWWVVLAVFTGLAAYRCAEVLTRGLLDLSSQAIDAWLYHRRAKRLRS
jgi:hypothetical protein